MLFRKTEHKRSRPYMALTIGTLAMIGAFSVVKCSKRTVRCMCDKMRAMFNGSSKCECSLGE